VERSEFYRKRAIVAEKTGDQRAAAESLVVALEIRPENTEALDLLVQLCRSAPDAYDFPSTFRELEKLYRKRDNTAPALARALIAQAALRERELEIDAAEQIYLEAFKLAPDEYRVVEALVSLHERLRRFDAGAAVLEAFVERARDLASRSAGRYRLAEILGDGAMDATRAAETLEELVKEDPDHREAHFRLAQELYLLGRYAEAHRHCERLIQLSAAPGHTVPPEELARYYDYLGRIAEASGDSPGAMRAYRRAIDLDPSYPPACLAMARRAAATGDRASAEAIVEQALQAAEMRGSHVDLALRRGLARFYVSLDEPARAIDAYRTVLARGPSGAENLDDRVSLAELLAQSDATLGSAREELQTVLSSDLKHVPAYRLLMHVYQRSGDVDRAARVATMLALLGYAEASDRSHHFRANVKRGTLSEELRRMRLLPPAVLGAFTDGLAAVREALEEVYGIPPLGNALPAAQVADPAFKVCVVDAQRLFGVAAEVYLAEGVPNGTLLVDMPRPTVFYDASLIDLGDGERRFLLGRAFEPLRGGYGMVMRISKSERAALGHLLEQLLVPEAEREPQVQHFVKELPRKAAKAVEKLVGLAPLAVLPTASPPMSIVDTWYAALHLAADRAGLLACDDVGAAARVLARLGGEEAVQTHAAGGAGNGDGALALGHVPGVSELVRFFLSDAYHELRSTLGDPLGRPL
jgi:tetratricopeptide (TPR) repeat protein